MCAPESLVAAAGIFGFMTAVAVGLVAAMLNNPVAGGAARLVWIGVRQSLHVQVPSPFVAQSLQVPWNELTGVLAAWAAQRPVGQGHR